MMWVRLAVEERAIVLKKGPTNFAKKGHLVIFCLRPKALESLFDPPDFIEIGYAKVSYDTFLD
jgi:hypothetical protein